MKSDAKPDLKAARRVRDPALLKALHLEWRECVLCGAVEGLSLHHVLKHPRDDVRANLVMLCGSGTTGCHGEIEHHHGPRCRELAVYLIRFRLDTIEHLSWRLNGIDGVREFLTRSLHARLPLLTA